MLRARWMLLLGLLVGCGPSLGSTCRRSSDCDNGLYCSNTAHGGAQRAEPLPTPPRCSADAECSGDTECVDGICLRAGQCEPPRP